jgi:large subunit ribosomal protein L30
MSQKIFIRQIKGLARQTERKKKTVRALGLGRIGKINVLPDNRQVRGMIRSVVHLVEVRHVQAK